MVTAMEGPVFEALADPSRRRIVEVLGAGERTVGELVQQVASSQPAVSRHLRVLREAGLVECRVDAQRRIYRVRAAPLRALDEWLNPYRTMWASALDDLERDLEPQDEEGRTDGRRPARCARCAR